MDADSAVVEDHELLCPTCGYDLRASAAGRCSECGHEIDTASLGVSRFPWVHRQSIGRISAYFKTLWLLTIGSKSLKYETAKPQSLKHARRFARVTAAILAALFLAVFAMLAIDSKGLSFLAVHPLPMYGPRKPHWSDDLLVPWSAGATMWPVMPLMLLVLGIVLSKVHQRLFRMPAASVTRRERAAAIACYAAAPLAWWPPLGAILVLLYLPTDLSIPIVRVTILGVFLFTIAHLCFRVRSRRLLVWIPLLALLCVACVVLSQMLIEGAALYGRHPMRITTAGLLVLIGVALPALRVEQWALRVRHAGMERALLDVPHLLGLWALAIIALLGLIPWCIGFTWIVIDSFL